MGAAGGGPAGELPTATGGACFLEEIKMSISWLLKYLRKTFPKIDLKFTRKWPTLFTINFHQ